MWLGANSGDMSFRVPDHYTERQTLFWIDAIGQKWRSFGNMKTTLRTFSQVKSTNLLGFQP
jgi:uncharacterized protein YigE (DUF2233 family)